MNRQSELPLSGKVVIITGASRGLGRQAALDFARRGAKVVLAARTIAPHATLSGTLGEALAQIEAMGGEALAVQTDLVSVEDLKRLVRATVDRFGGVDILINNAAATVGSMWSKQFLDLSREEWLYQFDINVHAPFTLIQEVVPIMERGGGGRIINVTTGCGEVFRLAEEPPPPPGMAGLQLVVPGYFASKRALDRLGSIIAPPLAAKNIQVIGLMPGWVATEVVQMRLEQAALIRSSDEPQPVPMSVPSRMLVYFAACADPAEYSGRLFFAERELATFGLDAGC